MNFILKNLLKNFKQENGIDQETLGVSKGVSRNLFKV